MHRRQAARANVVAGHAACRQEPALLQHGTHPLDAEALLLNVAAAAALGAHCHGAAAPSRRRRPPHRAGGPAARGGSRGIIGGHMPQMRRPAGENKQAGEAPAPALHT